MAMKKGKDRGVVLRSPMSPREVNKTMEESAEKER
jgi:hypothetical protein